MPDFVWDGETTMLAQDSRGNLSGFVVGNSCREVLLSIAKVATEAQAKTILVLIDCYHEAGERT